jgi:hypothetical protein
MAMAVSGHDEQCKDEEEPSPHSSIDAFHITLLLGRESQFPGDLEGGAHGFILVSSR